MLKMLLISAAAVATSTAVYAQPTPMGDAGGTTTFLTKAAQSDEFERQEGRLAEHRAENGGIKKFAAQMVKAHTRTTLDLKAAVRNAGMTPPPPPPLSDDQKTMMATLKAAHGRDFDKTYVDQQVQAHQETLGVMQGYAQNGTPGPIKDAAIKTAPLVQHHLEMAQGLQSKMGQ